MLVLVVDREPRTREQFRGLLAPHDILVHDAADLPSAVARVTRARFDAVFIEGSLAPRVEQGAPCHGIEVCRAVRAAGETVPVWMYSVVRMSGTALVTALDAGADDFLEAPLERPEQLVARLRAMKRRKAWDQRIAHVDVGSIGVDFVAREATVSGAALPLTPTQFSLLAYLAARRDRDVSCDDLYRDVLGHPERARESNALHMLVQRLRRKLGTGAPQLETVRGYGYRLRSGAATGT